MPSHVPKLPYTLVVVVDLFDCLRAANATVNEKSPSPTNSTFLLSSISSSARSSVLGCGPMDGSLRSILLSLSAIQIGLLPLEMLYIYSGACFRSFKLTESSALPTARFVVPKVTGSTSSIRLQLLLHCYSTGHPSLLSHMICSTTWPGTFRNHPMPYRFGEDPWDFPSPHRWKIRYGYRNRGFPHSIA